MVKRMVVMALTRATATSTVKSRNKRKRVLICDARLITVNYERGTMNDEHLSGVVVSCRSSGVRLRQLTTDDCQLLAIVNRQSGNKERTRRSRCKYNERPMTKPRVALFITCLGDQFFPGVGE